MQVIVLEMEKTAMQQRKRTIQWLTWVLVGTLWLLGGCVAPDGSVIRFKQASDGTITGLQVDPPADAAVTSEHGAPYPTRPVLFIGQVEEEWGIVGVDTDAGSPGIVANGT